MRDEKRIKRILKKIETIWTSAPDLRLGQLLYAFAEFRGDIFSIEDDVTEEKLTKAIMEHFQDADV